MKESTFPHTKTEGFGYGYMWWMAGNNGFDPEEFRAKGSYGNRIHVMPTRGVLLVHTVNTDKNGAKGVDDSDYEKLVKLILEAKTQKPG